jgi:serine/threonine protein kinase
MHPNIDETLPNEQHSQGAGTERQNHSIEYIRGALIGEYGAFSLTLGMNTETGELISLKSIPTTAGSISQASLNELASCLRDMEANSLRHSNVLEIYGYEEEDNNITILSEYMPAGCLREMTAKYGSLAQGLVRSAIRQILRGLDFLYANSVRHGNMSTTNVYLDNTGIIKISDYGFPESMVGQNARNSAVAPEILADGNAIDWEKVDVWSVGYIALELLLGMSPLENETFQFPLKTTEADPHRLDWSGIEPEFGRLLGPEVQELLNACLAPYVKS